MAPKMSGEFPVEPVKVEEQYRVVRGFPVKALFELPTVLGLMME